MRENLNGESVYVCYERDDNPKTDRKWVFTGVVSEAKDAKEWTNGNPPKRKAEGPFTIGVVDNYFS